MVRGRCLTRRGSNTRWANTGVDSRSVHSFIIGEHGDSEIAAWSSTNVSGIPLNDFCEMRGHFNHDAAMDAIAEKVKTVLTRLFRKTGDVLRNCDVGKTYLRVYRPQ